jgi:hypothetical protein
MEALAGSLAALSLRAKQEPVLVLSDSDDGRESEERIVRVWAHDPHLSAPHRVAKPGGSAKVDELLARETAVRIVVARERPACANSDTCAAEEGVPGRTVKGSGVGGGGSLSTAELRSTLRDPIGWLNDSVVNAVASVLILPPSSSTPSLDPDDGDGAEITLLSSYFLTSLSKPRAGASRSLEKWTTQARKANRWVLVPANWRSSHWSLLLVDKRLRIIRHYDSLPASRLGPDLVARIARALEPGDESFQGKKEEDGGWSVVDVKACPRQQDGSSCGLFLLAFVELLAHAIHARTDPDGTNEFLAFQHSRFLYPRGHGQTQTRPANQDAGRDEEKEEGEDAVRGENVTWRQAMVHARVYYCAIALGLFTSSSVSS